MGFIKVGQRVQAHPATDSWMRGDRYGEVVKVIRRSRTVVVVRMDSGRVVRFHPSNLMEVE